MSTDAALAVLLLATAAFVLAAGAFFAAIAYDIWKGRKP